MIRFPREARVSAPLGIRVEGDCEVSLRIESPGPSLDGLAADLGFYGARLKEVELGAEALLEGGALGLLGGRRLRIHADASAIRRAVSQAPRIAPALASWAVHEAAPDRALRCITSFAGLGLELRLPAAPWDGAAAPTRDTVFLVADYYLHNPNLAIPIQPFHGILLSLVGARPADLWEIEGNRPGRDVRLEEDGSAILPSAGRRIRLCGPGGGWDEMIAAAPGDLSARRAALLAARGKCAFCKHLAACGGYFARETGDPACEAWIGAFDLLAAEYRRGLRELGGADDEA